MSAQRFRIEHRVVGGMHMFTSPDLPELYVVHADKQTAEADVRPAVKAILRIRRPGYDAVPTLVEASAR